MAKQFICSFGEWKKKLCQYFKHSWNTLFMTYIFWFKPFSKKCKKKVNFNDGAKSGQHSASLKQCIHNFLNFNYQYDVCRNYLAKELITFQFSVLLLSTNIAVYDLHSNSLTSSFVFQEMTPKQITGYSVLLRPI